MSVHVLKISDAWSYTAEADNLVRMARELGARGHRVTIACSPETPLAKRAAEAGLAVRTLPGLRPRGNPIAFVRGALALKRLVRELAPDVVHAYRSPPHVLAAWALRGTGVKLVRTRGTMDAPRHNALNRALYDRATDATIVTAEAVRVQCLDAGFDPARIVTIHGALELERFDPVAHDKARARERLGLPRDGLVVGHLARLAPVKGHEFLLAAAREVPGARFVLVGPAWPGMEENVRGWARANGVEDRVTIAGRVDEPAAAIAAFDVGVVASVGSEAMSRAALEYLAMGVPVVATRVGSLPELVEEGVTGRLVPPRDPAALGAALRALLADGVLRARMSEAARRTALSRFGAEAQAAKLEALYLRVHAPRGWELSAGRGGAASP